MSSAAEIGLKGAKAPRMKVKIALIAISVALGTTSAAQAQLVRQSVQGIWRECVYHGPPTVGPRRPRESLGAPNERVARVGRGEPCPQAFPGERQANRRRPTDYVVLQ